MNIEKKIKLTIPEHEVMSPGHLACQGCGAALGMRYALKALGEKTIVSIPACCWAVIDGPFPYSAAGIPVFHCAFETAASTASGITHALSQLGQDNVTTLAWAGVGGTFRKCTSCKSAMSIPSSMVGEQKRHDGSPSRNRRSLASRSSYLIWAVCSRPSELLSDKAALR